MIYLDNRIGAIELQPELLSAGALVTATRLEYGDLFWVGNGPNGSPVTIGIERKRIGDLAASITSKRLSGHQLPGLLESYDHPWVIVEGRWRSSYNGYVEVTEDRHHGRWQRAPFGLKYAALEGYLQTLNNIVGVHVHRSEDLAQTATWVKAAYDWWTRKTWTQHHAHLAFQRNQPTMLLVKATLARRVAKEFPRIGWERSLDAENRFKTVQAMANATVEDWAEMLTGGKRLGMSAARAIVDAVQGRKHVTKE